MGTFPLKGECLSANTGLGDQRFRSTVESYPGWGFPSPPPTRFSGGFLGLAQWGIAVGVAQKAWSLDFSIMALN